MELFNNKVLMTTDLYPPQFSFDADTYELRFDLKDERDFSKIEYTLNGNTYVVPPFKKKSYRYEDAPYAIDTPYSLSYRVIPKNPKYNPITKTVQIYYNNARCINFRYGTEYGDDDKYSNSIYTYIGTLPNVYIPEKHNLVNTVSATLKEFPYLIGDEITITTPLYLTHLDLNNNGVKDQRIKTINNGSPDLIPIDDQFSDLSRLEVIRGNYFNSVSNRMFKNCPLLSMDPLMTSRITTFNNKTEVFYNTPSQRKIILNSSNIPAGTCDYSSTMTGYPNYQKVIFTRQLTINGFDQQSLITNESYTGGMVYTDPTDNQVKKHQVYTGLDLTWWTNVEPSDDTITFDGYDRDNNRLEFSVNDKNVLGMKLEIYSYGGTLKGALMWLPINLRKSNNDIADNYRTNTKFYLSDTQVYFDDMTSSENTGSGAIITIGGGPTNTDRIRMTPITCNGLSENTYTSTLMGDIEPVQPETPIRKIAYTGGATDNYTININNGAYTYSPGVGTSSGIYDMYITMDEEISNKTLMFRLYNSSLDQYETGRDGNITQTYSFTNNQYINVGGKKVYILNLNSPTLYNKTVNTLVGSSMYLRMYYNGYPELYWDLQLNKQLTGTTS